MAIVNNHDIAGLCRRLNLFIEEIGGSQSSSVHAMSSADQKRLMSYLDDLTTYRDWVMTPKEGLDLPKTHPRQIDTGANPVTDKAVNEAVRDLINLLEICRDELALSQSAQLASSLLPADDERMMAVVKKCKDFLASFIQKVQPVDMPETGPAILTASGKKS